MKTISIFSLLVSVVLWGGSMHAGAAVVVLEVENLKLVNAQARDLESASGKVVAFESEGAEARGEVELDRGDYEVYLRMFAPDPEQDAVYVSVGGTRERVFPSTHGTLTESASFPLNIPEKKQYPVAITFGEPGVLLDRLVIRSVPGQAITEPDQAGTRPTEVVASSTNVEPGPAGGRPRVIVTSDGEIDDECSMVRFLLHANEWDIEGIITSSSQYHWQGHKWAGDDWVQPYLDAYAKVHPNLVKHDPNYPTAEFLQERTFLGNVKAEGEMDEVTPGSQRIVEVLLDDSDPRSIWIQAWGGPNTIARALKTIEEEHPEKMAEVAKKIRLYFIWEQDKTYQSYIRPNWGKFNIPTIISDQFIAIFYHWKKYVPSDMQAYLVGSWMKANILENHGPLCALYKAHVAGDKGFDEGDFRSEGDSPAFLHTIPNGLRSMESPGWGGWGGRFVRVRDNTWLDPVLEHGYNYPEGRWYTSSAWGRTRLKKEIPNDAELIAYLEPQWRWIDAIQNDFAARADWCVKPYDQANHPPVVKLTNALDLKVHPGEKVSFGAKGTTDPDGNALTYRWWEYQKADTCPGSIQIEDSDKQSASVTVLVDATAGQTIHIICEVTDNGAPPLTRYQRVVMAVEH